MIISSYDSLPATEKKKLKELETRIELAMKSTDLTELAKKDAQSRTFYQTVRFQQRRNQTIYNNLLVGERQRG